MREQKKRRVLVGSPNLEGRERKPQRLVHFLKVAGLDRKDLAEVLRQTRSSISHYLSGTVQIPYGISLALKAEFGVNPVWFEEGIGDMYLVGSNWEQLDSRGEDLVRTYTLLEDETYKELLHMNAKLFLKMQQESKTTRGQSFKSNSPTSLKNSYDMAEINTLVENYKSIAKTEYRELLMLSSFLLSGKVKADSIPNFKISRKATERKTALRGIGKLAGKSTGKPKD